MGDRLRRQEGKLSQELLWRMRGGMGEKTDHWLDQGGQRGVKDGILPVVEEDQPDVLLD